MQRERDEEFIPWAKRLEPRWNAVHRECDQLKKERYRIQRQLAVRVSREGSLVRFLTFLEQEVAPSSSPSAPPSRGTYS